MEIRDVIAEGDKVVGHFKCSGTHRGDWQGIPPSGRRFEEVDEIYIFRVEDGKLTSATAMVEDNLTRLPQLGISPSTWGPAGTAPARRSCSHSVRAEGGVLLRMNARAVGATARMGIQHSAAAAKTSDVLCASTPKA